MNSIRNEIDLIAAFHLAMMVFAALQVHQTRTALCDDSVRRPSLLMTDSLTFCITVVQRVSFTLAEGATFPDRCTVYNCYLMVGHALLDQKALC